MGQKNKSEKPEVYQYHDYREYLRHWVRHQKEINSDFRLNEIAKSSQMSASYLSMVLAGNRKFSDKILERFLPHLKMNEYEESYFKLLRIIADSEVPEDRLKALEKIQKTVQYKKQNQKEIEAYRYLTKWYYVAIREMVQLKDFRMDPKWIRSRLKYPVSLSEISRALVFLKNSGFIEDLGDGKAKQTQKHIDCIEGVYKVALSKFHKEMFSRASESIELTPRHQRNLLFHMTAISKESFELIQKILNETLEKCEKVSDNETSPNSIYYISLAGFPITKIDETAECEDA